MENQAEKISATTRNKGRSAIGIEGLLSFCGPAGQSASKEIQTIAEYLVHTACCATTV